MFWENFQELCKINHTTPNFVCSQIGKSTATSTHWKNGSIPNGDVLVKIANYFNVSIDYLLDNAIESGEIRKARNRVKKLYEKYDTPIELLEQKLGIGYTTFRCWYNGYGDFFNNANGLARLADLFNVSIDYLLGRTDVPEINYGSERNVDAILDGLVNEAREREKQDNWLDDLAAKRESLDETVDALKQLKAERIPQ